MGDIVDHKDCVGSSHKVYVDVTEVRQKDGKVIPTSFVWEDGYRYEIDRIIDIRRAASLKASGMGLRYTVRIRNRDTYMFLEEECGAGKWFMERK